ncbi:MAG: nucleotidyltransferase family protein [Acidimicrobiales bacterium]
MTAPRRLRPAIRPATATARLLLRCVAEHDWATAPEGVADLAERAGPALVAAAAEFHGVSGCVHHSLAPVVDGARFAALAAAHRRGVERHVRALGELARLAPALDGMGGPWLVMKGPVLAELHYSRPDLRSYTDLDVVVPTTAVGHALAAVEATGGYVLDRNWPLLRELEVGEILVRLRHGTLLDLHWHLFNVPAVRRTFRSSMAEILERSRPAVLARTAVRTLDATDTLVHLGAHATLSGGHRLVWLKDLDRVIASGPPPWDDVVATARAWGVGPAVALSLDRARRILAVPVPPGVPEALAGGRAYLAAGAVADLVAPPARSSGRRSIGLMVSRAARPDTASTMAEFGRRLRAAVTDQRRPSLGPPTLDMDPGSRRSPRHDPGSDADRQAFLHAIASEIG